MISVHGELPAMTKHKLLAYELLTAGLRAYNGDDAGPIGILRFLPAVQFGGAPIVTFKRTRKAWIAEIRKELSIELLRRNPQLKHIHVSVLPSDQRFRIYQIDEQEGLNELVRALFAMEELRPEAVPNALHRFDSMQPVALLIDSLVGMAQFAELYVATYNVGDLLRQALSHSALFYGDEHEQTRALRLSLLAYYARESSNFNLQHEGFPVQDVALLVQLEVVQSRLITLSTSIGFDAHVDLERLGQLREIARLYWRGRRSEALKVVDSEVELAFSTACLVEILRRMESSEVTIETTHLTNFLAALSPTQKLHYDTLVESYGRR